MGGVDGEGDLGDGVVGETRVEGYSYGVGSRGAGPEAMVGGESARLDWVEGMR